MDSMSGLLSGKQRCTKMINLDALSEINKIIEQDKISSTYKFALLKSTIDACQRYEHLISDEVSSVSIPIGLLVESWIFDYLPFVFENRRQQNSGNVLNKGVETAYRQLFESMKLDPRVTTWQDAYQQIYMAYTLLKLDTEQSKILLTLAKEIAKTITLMPMKYSGSANYSIFNPQKKSFGSVRINGIFNREFLINSFDTFRISKDHYNIFRYMGQSLYGTSTIARRWKETTYKLNQETYATDTVDAMIFKTIFVDRNTNIGRNYLPQNCNCVWTNKPLKNGNYDVDHVLPYSVWSNNDLWNLLPSDSKVNNQKTNKIPTSELIQRQQKVIISYWDIYENNASELFDYQVKTSLSANAENKRDLIDSLCEKSDYLINMRGYDAFEVALY